MPVSRTQLNKLLVHRDNKLGSKIWQHGANYIITGQGGKDVGAYWVLEREDIVEARTFV